MYKIFYEERGTAAMEYGLLISLVGMAIAGFLQVIGGNIFEVFMRIDEVLSQVQIYKPG